MSSLDAEELRRILIQGRRALESKVEAINALNVFPVPDGDTGTNMLLTMKALEESVAQATDIPSSRLVATMARGALLGARGNSGVILAQGGEGQGYSLYLEAGAPVFAVRSSGNLKQMVGPKIPLEKWTHLVAVLAADGMGTLYLDGKPAGKPVKLHLVSSQPADNLNLGADAGSLVGNYDNPLPFVGKLEDVRLYWGTLRPKLIPGWFQPPAK